MRKVVLVPVLLAVVSIPAAKAVVNFCCSGDPLPVCPPICCPKQGCQP